MRPNPKPTIAKPAILSGRDAGLAKGQSTNISKSSKSTQQKTALEKFNDYWTSESSHLSKKQKIEHELKMAIAQNKQLKYEFKMKARTADHNAQLELLRLQIQLAQVNAAAGAASAVISTAPIASTSTIVPATSIPTYRPLLQSYNIEDLSLPQVIHVDSMDSTDIPRIPRIPFWQ